MRNLKRALSLALAAIMLIGMMVVSASAAGFDDFSDKDEIVNKDAVSMLTILGVINGKEDGSFFDPAGKVFERTQIEVPKCNRLRMLGVVCIARYNGIFVLLCLSEQGIHQEGNRFTHIQQCLSGIHALNGQVHIIAGTAGVELSASFYPQFLNQPFLQIGEEIR